INLLTCSSFDLNCISTYYAMFYLPSIDNFVFQNEVTIPQFNIFFTGIGICALALVWGGYNFHNYYKSRSTPPLTEELNEVEKNRLIKKLARYSITVSEDFFSASNLGVSEKLVMLELLITNHWRTGYVILKDDMDRRSHCRKEFYFQYHLLGHFGWKDQKASAS